MPSRFKPNRMDLFALLAIAVTTFFFWRAALDAAGLYVSWKPMSATEIVLGCLGWVIATFAPITLAVVFWRWSKRLQKAWLLHLMVMPLAFAIFTIGSDLILFAAGSRDFDDTLGGPILQAVALLLLAVIGYYSAVVYTALKRWSAPANRG